jgi:hypothetical protein
MPTAQLNANHHIEGDPPNDIPHQHTFNTLLPALHSISRTEFRPPEECLDDFYKDDLNISRLNDIHDWLWLAGRPEPARPLHRQKMLRREIVIVEQADLHLVWDGSRIFIKPLPRYLLFPDFWAKSNTKKELQESARGFMRSYSWLIRYESDFAIATELHLVPAELKWPRWRQLVAECYQKDMPVFDSANVNKRYCYGELRQGRLNYIYRIARGSIIRGYEFGYNQYGTFFSRNFAWMITVFAYVTIALVALQVGLATDRLGKDPDFQRASYGFGVFSLLLPIIVTCLALAIFVLIFVNNFIQTRNVVKERKAVGYLV